MSAELLDGSGLAKRLKAELARDAAAFAAENGVIPTLAVVWIGDDEAAAGYARAIVRNCKGAGINTRQETLGEHATQQDAERAIDALNRDESVHGIMILEPVPDQIDLPRLINRLSPVKDVDGVHPANIGRLVSQRPPYFVPATPAGGMRLLEEAGVEFRGKRAVVVGRSDIVGKPMAMLLLHKHCTVTIAHSRTQDLAALCSEADILCVAVGRAEMVRGDWIKPGAVVIDFGTNYSDDGVQGDCAQDEVAQVAGMLTPVPGGTGPMTNYMLLDNVLRAAHLSTEAFVYRA
ncbi:MAG: bifunctional 5,10-methylenetetrahydrofolate dehydrogenase/5,10-methenyltetrahydrofolate cyclohydrolase [Litorilinea sp.]